MGNPNRKRELLFNKSGLPVAALANCLAAFDCSTLDELHAKVKERKIWPRDIYRIKGCGKEGNPGLLPQYLFDIQSAQERRVQAVIDNAGAGI